jgi:hypothetical protein
MFECINSELSILCFCILFFSHLLGCWWLHSRLARTKLHLFSYSFKSSLKFAFWPKDAVDKTSFISCLAGSVTLTLHPNVMTNSFDYHLVVFQCINAIEQYPSDSIALDKISSFSDCMARAFPSTLSHFSSSLGKRFVIVSVKHAVVT